MNPARLLAILAFSPLIAYADNYATCILDKMPEAQGELEVTAAYQLCRQAYPAGLGAVDPGSGRSIFSFSYQNGTECTADKASTIVSRRGAMLIGAACRRLYDGSSGSWTSSGANAAGQDN